MYQNQGGGIGMHQNQGGGKVKPIIGITAKISHNENIGIISNQGVKQQSWQLLSQGYIKSVEQAGGIPIIIPIFSDFHNIQEVIKSMDGIIFSGGNDIDPQHYDETIEEGDYDLVQELDIHEIQLCNKIIHNTDMPVLGICRGHQLINVVHGGTLYQEIKRSDKPDHRSYPDSVSKYHLAHDIIVDRETMLYKILGKEYIKVNSFHHQIIKKIGTGLKVSALSPDGVVEAVEGAKERFLLGVQWHPEMLAPVDSINDVSSQKIFQYFINECIKFKKL